jgi:hypothetical protein
LFLMETKFRNAKLQAIRGNFGYEGMITVEPVGRSGGLAFLWMDTREVEIINYSLRHISATIRLVDFDFSWKFTGFYGHPDRAMREESWQLLNHLSIYNPQDWFCVGDFNEILDLSKKVRGMMHNDNQMESFRSTLAACNLGDLGYRVSKFTWCNQRNSEEFIQESLDRALATTSWCSQFPNMEV